VSVLARRPIISSVVLIAIVAIVDYVTDVEMTFVELTYLLPITLATWHAGRVAGIGLAVLAAFSTTAIFVHESTAASASSVTLNAIGALGMFGAMVWILDALRGHVERERAQRRLAVEQLRHSERLNVIGVLAAGVAHELGTPLNVISGAAEMLEELEPDRADAHRAARMILTQTDRITSIIRHLLDFGRRGNASSKQLIDPECAAASAVELLTPTAQKAGTTIKFTASALHGRVRADLAEIEQVVSNLILNGIQAMPRGGTLEVATAIEGGFAAISVVDAGTGIREADLPFIFDPFFTTKGVGQGTGLGLSVSYGIIGDCGGTIDVASALGAGTKFVVRLPLAQR